MITTAQVFVVATYIICVQQSTATENAFVQANVVNVREAPHPEAKVLGRLRINTGVTVTQKSAGWSKVEYRRLQTPALTGWVFSEFLGSQNLIERHIKKKLKTTTDPRKRIAWLERWVAIKPLEKTAWKRLVDAYTKAGQSANASSALRTLEGTQNVYVAVCDRSEGMRAILVAVIGSDGGVQSLTGYPKHSTARENQNLDRLASELSAIQWFVPHLEAPIVLTGTTFPTPTVAREDKSPHALVLGDCSGGTDPSDVTYPLFFSQPVTRMSTPAALLSIEIDKYAAAFSKAFEKASTYENFMEPDLVEQKTFGLRAVHAVQLSSTKYRDSYFEWAYENGHTRQARGIFDDKGSLVAGGWKYEWPERTGWYEPANAKKPSPWTVSLTPRTPPIGAVGGDNEVCFHVLRKGKEIETTCAVVVSWGG